MSIDSLTIEEFMRLDAAHHELALNLYDEKIAECRKQLNETNDPLEAEQLVAEWGRSATIRKIHAAAFEEMQAEDHGVTPQTA